MKRALIISVAFTVTEILKWVILSFVLFWKITFQWVEGMGWLLKQFFLVNDFLGNWETLKFMVIYKTKFFSTLFGQIWPKKSELSVYAQLIDEHMVWFFYELWFKLKFSSLTPSNMLNLTIMFILFWTANTHFWANLVQKIKTVSLRWKLIPRLVSICKMRWYQNLQKFVAGIFKVKIDLSPELMNDTFEFIKKRSSLRYFSIIVNVGIFIQ